MPSISDRIANRSFPRSHQTSVSTWSFAGQLVQAWAELHREELLADWQLVMNAEKPFAIQPLQ